MIVQPNKITPNTVPNYNPTSYSHLTQTNPQISPTTELNNNHLPYNNEHSHDQNNNHNITPSHINDDVTRFQDNVPQILPSTSNQTNTPTSNSSNNLNN
jgi:hypothetical protein